MSLYRFVALVIFFSTWINAREVFVDLPGTSVGWTKSKPEESRKKWTGDTIFVKVTCTARSWTQFFRRFLKTIRKWFRTHPTEMQFGSCIANYFHVKIPLWRRGDQFEYSFRDREKPISMREREPRNRRKAENEKKSSKSISKIEKSSIQNVASLLSNNYQIFKNAFSHYRDLIAKNHLVMCAWNYFVRKFWNWVDSAPSE